LAVVNTITFFYTQILKGLINLHVPYYCLVIETNVLALRYLAMLGNCCGAFV
jgi:hypothetical protein